MKKRTLFPKIRGRILYDEPLKRHTTFRLGGPCKAWCEPEDEKDLERIIKFSNRGKEKVNVIGGGSNILFKETGFDGILIHLCANSFKGIKFHNMTVRAGAGSPLNYLVERACEAGLGGIEGLAGIPGTVGGAVLMNSGYKSGIAECIREVRVMRKGSGQVRTIKRSSIKFGYRDSGILRDHIVLDATLGLKRENPGNLIKRKNTLLNKKIRAQPLDALSAGCIFRNPDAEYTAAKYIELSKLKGKRIGEAKISERHANFIVNMKNAREDDVFGLIRLVQERVNKLFGIRLDTEVIII